MTREELRDYVELQRSLNNIPYHVYSALIDGIDTLEQEPTTTIEIEEYKEVTLEELLALKDKASWSGDTEDDKYQIYHVLPDYEPIKIKKSIVLEYLEKKDKENKGNE